ncbi:hypothetical protein TNCV_4323101 [Trichonephila clavipes]|nr:hypothetical protein TNCV_4323101 [Trichonephila clavipes]
MLQLSSGMSTSEMEQQNGYKKLRMASNYRGGTRTRKQGRSDSKKNSKMNAIDYRPEVALQSDGLIVEQPVQRVSLKPDS